MDLRTQRYALNRGLDLIDYRSSDGTPALPDALAALLPPEESLPAQLRLLLDKPDLADFLESSFSPENWDMSLLTPQRYTQTLQSTVEALRAAQMPGSSETAGDVQKNLQAILSNALSVMDWECSLRTALRLYQNLLLRG